MATTTHSRCSRPLGIRLVVACALVALIAPPVVLGVVSAPVIGLRPPGVAFASSPMEDCDLDGYDDHTGAPVPWAGFDGTRGDEVPAGWDGVSNSWTGAHTNDNSGGSSGSGSGSGSGSSGSSSKSSSSGSSGTKKSSSSSGSSKTGSSSSKAAASGTGATVTKTTVVPSAAAASGGAGTAPGSTAALAAPASAPVAVNDTQTIVGAGGALTLTDAEGARLHVDGQLRVAGTKFAPLVDALDISIDSIGQKLDTVASDENGAFNDVVDLPKGLTPGPHSVIISYHNIEIIRRPIEFGPATAGTFLQALSVGFSDANPDRQAGLLTLAGLALLGFVSYGSAHVLRRPSERASARVRRQREFEPELDEPVSA